MINFNENLYTTQWLDLVFQNRNKSYGAYQLRKHNNETMTKAFLYACVLLSSIIIIGWVYTQVQPVSVAETPLVSDPLEVNLSKIREDKPIEPPRAQTPRQEAPLRSVQYTNVVVAAANQNNIEPPSQAQIAQAVVSTVNVAGADATGINPVEIPAGSASGTSISEPLPASQIFSIDAIQTYPEFPGGQEAFMKFLRKNLRYPNMAVEQGIQGKVFLSFIIEKNGDLSHIKVMRGVGSGLDEEAVRVLMKSPQWKPGIQNNQEVRVAYTLPISFSLSN